jgi:hypothetical protein
MKSPRKPNLDWRARGVTTDRRTTLKMLFGLFALSMVSSSAFGQVITNPGTGPVTTTCNGTITTQSNGTVTSSGSGTVKTTINGTGPVTGNGTGAASGISTTCTGTVTISSNGTVTSGTGTVTATCTGPVTTTGTGTSTTTTTCTGTVTTTINGVSSTSSNATITTTTTGTGPTVTISPTSVTFPSQAVNSTSGAQTVTLTNTGSSALSNAKVTITGTYSGDFSQNNNCGRLIASGVNCTIYVTFTPAASGTVSATLTVTDNAGNSPQTITLSGAGLSGTQLTCSSLFMGCSQGGNIGNACVAAIGAVSPMQGSSHICPQVAPPPAPPYPCKFAWCYATPVMQIVTVSFATPNSQSGFSPFRILGVGFGSSPFPSLPFVGDVAFIKINDYTNDFAAAGAGLLLSPDAANNPACSSFTSVWIEDGAVAQNGNGCYANVTAKFTAWSDTEIDIAGFSNQFGTGQYIFGSADRVTIQLANPVTGGYAAWSGTIDGSSTPNVIEQVSYSQMGDGVLGPTMVGPQIQIEGQLCSGCALGLADVSGGWIAGPAGTCSSSVLPTSNQPAATCPEFDAAQPGLTPQDGNGDVAAVYQLTASNALVSWSSPGGYATSDAGCCVSTFTNNNSLSQFVSLGDEVTITHGSLSDGTGSFAAWTGALSNESTPVTDGTLPQPVSSGVPPVLGFGADISVTGPCLLTPQSWSGSTCNQFEWGNTQFGSFSTQGTAPLANAAGGVGIYMIGQWGTIPVACRFTDQSSSVPFDQSHQGNFVICAAKVQENVGPDAAHAIWLDLASGQTTVSASTTNQQPPNPTCTLQSSTTTCIINLTFFLDRPVTQLRMAVNYFLGDTRNNLAPINSAVYGFTCFERNRVDYCDYTPFEGPPNSTASMGPGGVHVWYYSNPYPIVTPPAAIAQLNVAPFTILYFPPGNQSQETFTGASEFQNTFTASTTQAQTNTASIDTKTGISSTLTAPLVIDDEPPIGTAMFTVSGTWDTKTETQVVNTTSNENEIQAQVTSSVTLNSQCSGPCEPPNMLWAGQNLFWFDQVIVFINPQFAIWDMVMCESGNPPNGTDCGGSPVVERTLYNCPVAVSPSFPYPCGSDQSANPQLVPCWNGTAALQSAVVPPCPLPLSSSSSGAPPAPVALAGAVATEFVAADPVTLVQLPIWELFENCAGPGTSWSPTLSPSGQPTITLIPPLTLQPQDCWNLINLDPFAAGQGQSTPIDVSREIDVGAIINFGASCPTSIASGDVLNFSGSCTIDSATLSQNQQYTGVTTATGSVSDQTTITSSATLMEEGKVTIGPVTFGGSVTETGTNSNSMNMTYKTSQSVLNQSALSSQVLLQDSNVPISTAIWLDQMFGSYMFPDATAPSINLQQMASSSMNEQQLRRFIAAHSRGNVIRLTATSPGWNHPPSVGLGGDSQDGPWTSNSAGAVLKGTFRGGFVAILSDAPGSQFKVSIDGADPVTTNPTAPIANSSSVLLQKELRAGEHTIEITSVSTNGNLVAYAAPR